jgi:hypothetical protein
MHFVRLPPIWPVGQLFNRAVSKEGKLSASVLAAVITGSLGFIASVVSLVFTRRTQDRQLVLKDRLDRMAHQEDAWRSYEFEARKRLYADVRPLLFQIAEHSHLGRDRIVRVLKNEYSPHDRVGTTALWIFEPLVLGRELQHRLTNVDLALDPAVRTQYAVIREMLTNLHAGKAIAAVEPRIPYRENNEQRGHLTWSQIERVIDLFTVREEKGSTRPLRQGEFEEELVSEHAQEIQEKLAVVNDLFGDLPPSSSRVLGRLLLAQAAFMNILIEMQASSASNVPASVLPVDANEINWRCMEPLDTPAAEAYVRGRLKL